MDFVVVCSYQNKQKIIRMLEPRLEPRFIHTKRNVIFQETKRNRTIFLLEPKRNKKVF
jgi:hypothetical protein